MSTLVKAMARAMASRLGAVAPSLYEDLAVVALKAMRSEAATSDEYNWIDAAILEHSTSSHDCATASGQNAGDKSGHQSDSRPARVGNESAERSSDESSAPHHPSKERIMTAAIPDDIREAAWRALESNKTRGDAIGVLVTAILDERERCAIIVETMQSNYGALVMRRDAAELIRNQPPAGE